MSSATQPARVTTHFRETPRKSDRIFYCGFSIAAIGAVIAGFGQRYYFPALSGVSTHPLTTHLHALAFSAWMALFAVQSALIAARRVRAHRTLGILGVILGAVILAVGYSAAIVGARTGWVGANNPRDLTGALGFLVVPLGDLVLFAGFFGAAIYYRGQPELHKRLMILAMMGGILAAPLARIPFPYGLIISLALLFAGPVYDRLSRGQIHRAYLWGVPLVLLSFPVRLLIGTQSQTWSRFAAWLIH
jgi:hypothetical protein